jgi:hypothetical protein
MFLVPQNNLAIAMVMNTYSPMLGVRVSRVPSNVLRMLLYQVTIPGYGFRYMQIVHAGVMLIPLLHLITILATFRAIMWGVMRTGIGISMLRQTVKSPAAAQHPLRFNYIPVEFQFDTVLKRRLS